MSHRMTRGALAGTLIVLQGFFPAVSDAGPILDWLFGRRHTTQYALYCPTTTACSPVTASPCSPCGQAATAYSPIVQAAQPVVQAAPALAAPTVVNYAPQTYQTFQAQVPHTYYRPTTALSPIAGAQTSTMAGCTLVQVQTQRRPVGLFGWLFGARQPVSPYPINVQYPTTTTGYAAAGVAVPSYAAPSMQYAAPSMQYAAPAAGNCQGCTGSSTFPTIPSAPVNPGSSILSAPPAATYPAPSGSPGGATTSPAGPTPADQPPSLNAPPQGNYQGQQNSYQGSSYRAAPATPITPPQHLNEAAPQGDAPQAAPPSNSLQLIPYPGDDQPAPESPAPRQLNHRGRTASLRQSEPWSFSLISWETNDARPAAAVETTPAPTTPSQVWDDTGWRSAR